MKIGIDASRAFAENRTGTEEYSYQIIRHILELPQAKEHEWILYLRPNLKFNVGNLKLTSNCKLEVINLPILWTQMGLAWQTWTDNLDVLWVPAHTLSVLRKPGLRTVVTIHGIEYEWLPAYENLLQRWYLPLSTKYAIHTASNVIAVSHFTKEQLINRLNALPDKIKVVHEGYSTPLPVSQINQKSVLKKFNLQPKSYILFIGTIQPRKNLERLIEAFSLLKIENLKLVIAGKYGWSYQSILKTPDKLGITDKVTFTGYTNETEKYILLQNALVYVQPSITEGFGLPVLEAFAADIPVISSNGGALEELGLGDNLFDPYDVKTINGKMSWVIDNSSVQKDLINRGKIKLREFSWLKAAKETYKILVDN